MRTNRNPLWSWLGLLGWPLLGAIALVLIMGILALTPLGAFEGFVPLLAAMALAMWAQAALALRRRRWREVLGYIQQAVTLNIPIPTVLWAALQGESPPMTQRLNHLRVRLEDGVPLDQALTESVPEMPDHVADQIAAAQRLGRLDEVLTRLTRPTSRVRRLPPEHVAFCRAYPPAMLLVLVGVCALILWIVTPKFVEICRGFHVPVPPATRLLMQLPDQVWLIWVVICFALLWIGQIVSRIAGGEHYFGSFLDYVAWYVPIQHSRLRDRGMTDLCRVVGDAVSASWPIDRAIHEAAAVQSNKLFANRVIDWANRVTAGQSLRDAARAARMPSLLVGMLATSRSADDLAHIMSFLVRHYEWRVNRVEILLQAAWVPIMVGIMGLLVGFVTYSLFSPLVVLIEAAANHLPSGVR